ncbi:MAG: KH domain-containing protein [Parachlamydiales bacterium]
MEQFVEYLVKNLVDDPEQVQVKSRTDGEEVMIEFKVGPNDIARVIGRQGRTIQALRTLVMTAGARLGTRVRLELIEDGRKKKEEPEGEG